MEENNTLFQSIIGNHLIGNLIVSYLSYADMKMASLVSQDFHEMVRSSKLFSKTMTLRLTSHKKLQASKDNQLDQLQLNSFSFGMVEFDTTMSPEIVKFLENNYEILGNIRTLRLTRMTRIAKQATKYERETLLEIIFENCHKVEKLEIDLQLLMRQDFRQLLQPQLCEGIKNLEIFSTHYYSARSDKNYMALKNLKHFSTMSQLKLENLKIGRFTSTDSSRLYFAIMNLISSKIGTLQSLNLNTGSMWSLYDSEKMKNFQIPNLKQVIQLEIVETDECLELVQFLENQPPLQNLATVFEKKCPTVFLEYLEKKAESFRTLKLSAFFLQTSMDWKFLANCFNLNEFTIIQRRKSGSVQYKMNATGVSFLKWLPPTVTKLCLRGLKHFWKDQDDLRGDDISESMKILLLSGFPLMTKLDLIGCTDGVVTDLVVQKIIAKMPKLQILKFSHGSCTDFALSGISDGKVGLSLTGLIGLTHLAINWCPGISIAALLTYVKHSFLQSLEYRYCNELTPDQVEQLVSQNPFLTSLSIQVKGEKDLITDLKTKLETIRYWKRLNLDF